MNADDFIAGIMRKVEERYAQQQARLAHLKFPHGRTNDQANANRLYEWFGEDMMIIGSRCHYWTGKYWDGDHTGFEIHLASCAQELPEIVAREAKELRERTKRVDEEGNILYLNQDEINRNIAQAELLERHATKCGNRNVQEAATKMLRLMLPRKTADEADRDRMVLNVGNGTIDLRREELRPHCREDYITHCIPIDYDPRAAAPKFEKLVHEIFDGDEAVLGFVQRWFGYCATGETNEQKFLVHLGEGSNGKTLLVKIMSAVLGDFAAAAAPDLIVEKRFESTRHPAEIADLWGRRTVTVFELADGAVLRVDFIKQLTGGDRLKGRDLYKEFFEFTPTLKLQIVTQHTPQISGTDNGIWRRPMILKYPVIFGTPRDMEEGKCKLLRDNSLLDTILKEELEGILNWNVKGARWWNEEGLNPPACVLENIREYRDEQDRTKEFVEEACEVGPEKSSEPQKLFDHYRTWTQNCGYKALGRRKFLKEILRVVPTARRALSMSKRLIRGIDVKESF